MDHREKGKTSKHIRDLNPAPTARETATYYLQNSILLFNLLNMLQSNYNVTYSGDHFGQI